jgi:sulfofructose kinase
MGILIGDARSADCLTRQVLADGAEPRYDLLGFGIAAVDDIIEVAEFPRPGTKQEVLSKRRHGGGLCATALVAAAHLGCRCYYAGVLGRNDLSDFIRSVFKREGIGYSEETRFPDAQPCHSVILVQPSTGERTILHSHEGVIAPAPGHLRLETVARARALFVDQLGPACGLEACHLARDLGIPTIGDIERTDDDAIRELSEAIDHLIVPIRVANALSGCSQPEAATYAMHHSRACTTVTDGVRGCWFIEGAKGGVRHQPAFRVRAVDTTGCGDVFHGAYAAGLLSGMTAAERIRFAAAVAAIKATQPGGQTGIPNRAAVERFLETVCETEAAGR